MDKEHNQELLSSFIEKLQLKGPSNKLSYRNGIQLYELGKCFLMTSSTNGYSFSVLDDYKDFKVNISFKDSKIETLCSCQSIQLCSHVYAATFQAQQEMNRISFLSEENAVKYSREGMMSRVMKEREDRALQEKYELEFADNIFGEHQLKTSHNKTYHLSFYHFEKKLGYCSCPDYQTNKLETCKHLIYAFNEFSKQYKLDQLPLQTYPFLEIFRHPLNDYQIAWFYPHAPEPKIEAILHEYFDENQIYKKEKLPLLHRFLEEIKSFKSVNIRSEVKTYISDYFESKSLKELYSNKEFPKHLIKNDLFKYQEEGAIFSASRKGAILADEIGLGKTAQALSAALLKIKYSGLLNVKILVPNHLLPHWELEINKWVPEDKLIYFHLECFNHISSQENCDFLIIDEAQKIDDYESDLLNKIRQIDFKHILLVTDSKFETSLMKFYAISSFINPHLMAPLWELSYKHCLFDSKDKNKILGYYKLEQIAAKLENVYLRREKSMLINQLPEADLVQIPVGLNEPLKLEQSQLSKKLLISLKKDQLNQFELLQFKDHLQLLLQLGQSSQSINNRKTESPKLIEFRHFISHKLNLDSTEKAIVFASSKTIQYQILRILLEERKKAIVLNGDQHENLESFQFYICSETSKFSIPQAKHMVFFNIPTKGLLLQDRINSYHQESTDLFHNRFYLFQCVNNIESLIFQWEKTKPLFLKQLLSFLNDETIIKDISLRLKEELSHELKSFVREEEPKETPLENIQTDLFGREIQSKKAKLKSSTAIHDSDGLNHLFNLFKSILPIYDGLKKEEKDILIKGQTKVSIENNEIIIRIKK